MSENDAIAKLSEDEVALLDKWIGFIWEEYLKAPKSSISILSEIMYTDLYIEGNSLILLTLATAPGVQEEARDVETVREVFEQEKGVRLLSTELIRSFLDSEYSLINLKAHFDVFLKQISDCILKCCEYGFFTRRDYKSLKESLDYFDKYMEEQRKKAAAGSTSNV